MKTTEMSNQDEKMCDETTVKNGLKAVIHQLDELIKLIETSPTSLENCWDGDDSVTD